MTDDPPNNPVAQAADSKHAVVVGVGPGIGGALARRFATAGFSVSLIARNRERLHALGHELHSSGRRVSVQTADVADPAQLRGALAAIRNEISPPGVLLYNAAFLAFDNLLDLDIAQLVTAHAINVVGAVVCAQELVPAMRESGNGTIILTGGGLADQPQPTLATLSLGKLTLRGVGTILSRQLTGDNIHVSSVTISGEVAYGTAFDPNRIAETFWEIHNQPRQAWRADYLFDGR
jgi:short-subunit dehydrogenase